jgi:predicted P-loop ATPase
MSDSYSSANTAESKAQSNAERLLELFHSDAKKHVEISEFKGIRKDGKHEFKKSITVQTPLTVEHVQAHLEGKIRAANIPLRENDTASFGCIDIDQYNGSLDPDLNERIPAIPLPLYFSYSKSGGGRIWLFCEEPVAASTLRKTLQAVSKALGLPKKNVEIYPKQDTTSSADKFGNALELPYCGMKYDEAIDTCMRRDLIHSLLLEDFLGLVKKAAIAQIKNFTAKPAGGKGTGGATRDVNELVNKLNNETRELLKEPHHRNRSDACWSIITEMINKGFSGEEILLVLRNYPNGPTKHYTDHNSSPAEDIKRIRIKYKRNSFDWPKGTLKTKDGRPYQNVHNVALALRSPDLDGLFTYDEMERKAKVTEPLPDVFDGQASRKNEFPYTFRDEDGIHMQAWFQTIGMTTVAEKTVGSGIYLVGMNRSFHPVKQYLDLLNWDNTPRLNTWLSCCLGIEDNEYHKMVGRKFLLSMIARIYRPGCKVDYMMVLVGEQGKLKSMVASTLAGKWFSDNLPNLRFEKDAALHMNGKWLIEMGELAAIRKQDDEHIKTFIVRQFDKYRPPYGHVEVDEPRQCVFMGTTNKQDFLHDETGGRRYWPVEVVKIDIEWLKENRDQLFAEAKACFDKGEAWWPTAEWEEKYAKPQQEKHQEMDEVWEEAVTEYVSEYQDKVRPSDIFRSALDFKDVKDIKPADYYRLRKILIKLSSSVGRSTRITSPRIGLRRCRV